jgi:hypothetical protein
VKKLGKKADMSEFRAQLDSIGVKIVEVTADGNCFFRFRTPLLGLNSIRFLLVSKKERVGFSSFFLVPRGWGGGSCAAVALHAVF